MGQLLHWQKLINFSFLKTCVFTSGRSNTGLAPALGEYGISSFTPISTLNEIFAFGSAISDGKFLSITTDNSFASLMRVGRGNLLLFVSTRCAKPPSTPYSRRPRRRVDLTTFSKRTLRRGIGAGGGLLLVGRDLCIIGGGEGGRVRTGDGRIWWGAGLRRIRPPRPRREKGGEKRLGRPNGLRRSGGR